MEVLTKSKSSNTMLEKQKQAETLINTLNYLNSKGKKTIFDVHNYGDKGVIYFKKK